MAFGEGERGLLNGWASPVDVAGGGTSRAGGETCVDASGTRENEVEEKKRYWVRRAVRARRQVRQIIVVVWC
jgi:hypothetical protein